MGVGLLTPLAAPAYAASDDGVHDNPMGDATAPWDTGGLQ